VPSAATAPPTSLSQDKSQLRLEARRRRHELALREAPALAGERAVRQILSQVEFPPGSVVSAYWPMGDELDCTLLIRTLSDAGCIIGLPVVVAKGEALRFRRWTAETEFLPGGFNTQIPHHDEPEVVPERLIVPLLAFDRGGYRLGYGGGFYDRTLAHLRRQGPVLAIGFAYAGQEVAAVPRDQHDQKLDWLATEEYLLALGTTP
jgi:5-formyltetrahydrofolate cyclo-ligase